MNMSNFGSFSGASHRGVSALHELVRTEANKATDYLECRVTEVEGSFATEHVIRPSADAFDRAWKETRFEKDDAWRCLGGMGLLFGLSVFFGSIFRSTVTFSKGGFGDWYLNMLCAGAFGTLALGFLACVVCLAFDGARAFSRGYDEDTWRLRHLAGEAWYIGGSALHTTRGGWGSSGVKTIFYDAIGVVLVEGGRVEIEGRDGSWLASIEDPSRHGMDAAEIVSLLKGAISAATRQ